MTIRLFSLPLLCSAALAAQSPSEATSIPTFFGADPLAHTFSIVARDSTTGELGIAVQRERNYATIGRRWVGNGSSGRFGADFAEVRSSIFYKFKLPLDQPTVLLGKLSTESPSVLR